MKRTPLVAALLVFSSGLFALAARQDAAVRPILQHMERSGTRVLFFGQGSIAGQFHIDYGRPVWKEEYEQQMDRFPVGTRLRFGKDFWTTLETNVPLTIGGVQLDPNEYYLALERSKDGFSLVAFEAAPLRARRLPSFQPPQTGGVVVPMKMEKTDDLEEELSVEFVVENATGAVSLEVAWGPYVLEAPVEAELPSQ